MDVKNITAMVDEPTEHFTRVMTKGELMREEHQNLNETYKIQDLMNPKVLLIIMALLIVGQVILSMWKRMHFKSFQIVTLLELWVFPLQKFIRMSFWWFIVFWTLSSLITGLILQIALEKILQGSTPKLVYSWFYFIYKLTYVLGIVGYFILVTSIFRISDVFRVDQSDWIKSGLIIMFYGLYFGVLVQDVAEIFFSVIAADMAYHTPQGMPTQSLNRNICAVCGINFPLNARENCIIESTFQLPCGHIFHKFCIRGWCIVGKIQTCPYCKENVYIEQMFHNLWEKPYVLYDELLDWIHWFIDWVPIISCIFNFSLYILGMNFYDIYNEIVW